jgi:DNA repair exonuclease SbcCD ATPase subunit
MFQREVSKLKKENIDLKSLNVNKDSIQTTKEISTTNIHSKAPLKENISNLNLPDSKQTEKLIEDYKLQIEKYSLHISELQYRLADLDKKEKHHAITINELNESKSKCNQLMLQLEANANTLESIMMQKDNNSNELDHVIQERDDLLKALEDFGNEISQVQSKIIILTGERDNALQLYQQLAESKAVPLDKNRVVPEVAESIKPQPPYIDTSSTPIVNPLTKENEILKDRINNLVNEIEKLQSDIQVMVQRQRETGSMANEALTQLEIEVEG